MRLGVSLIYSTNTFSYSPVIRWQLLYLEGKWILGLWSTFHDRRISPIGYRYSRACTIVIFFKYLLHFYNKNLYINIFLIDRQFTIAIDMRRKVMWYSVHTVCHIFRLKTHFAECLSISIFCYYIKSGKFEYEHKV